MPRGVRRLPSRASCLSECGHAVAMEAPRFVLAPARPAGGGAAYHMLCGMREMRNTMLGWG